MKVLHIVGARPQFIKLAPVSAELEERGHHQVVVHTGQHFDDVMSEVFFRELSIGRPSYDLGVHSLTHGAMTGRMLEGIEKVLLEETPDVTLVYGDTNSTLAGVLAAAKLNIACGHVEAGLRSFNRSMPEELNRIATDHLADLLFAPTNAAMVNLSHEGLAARSQLVGDVMFDAMLRFSTGAPRVVMRERLQVEPGYFFLATLHRAATTNDAAELRSVVTGLEEVARTVQPVVVPLHPRTRKAMERADIRPTQLQLISPVSYIEMLALLQDCSAVLTDSGGLQKEAYFAQKLCFTLRTETEWVETVHCGANILCGTNPQRIQAEVDNLDSHLASANFSLGFYGDGNAAALLADGLATSLGK